LLALALPANAASSMPNIAVVVCAFAGLSLGDCWAWADAMDRKTTIPASVLVLIYFPMLSG
jgi:hypothetical protein